MAMMTATRMALKNPNTAGEIKFNLGSCQWGVQGTSQSPTDRFGIFRRRIAGVNLREGRFGIGVQYRAYIGSRHIEVTEDIVKEPGAIETVDFGAEVAASFLIGGPMSNSTTDGDKAMSKTSCADRYHLRVHTGLLPRIFLLSSRARSAH
jgi:hypothetical protein